MVNELTDGRVQGAATRIQAFLKSAFRRWPLYSVAVLLPMLLALIYFTAIGTPGYVSRAQLIVERDSTSSVPGIDIGLFDLSGSASQLDSLLIQTYITSRAMLDYLQQELDLRAHFQSDKLDWWSRLWRSDSQEDFYKYYLRHVSVSVDSDSTVISLEVSAFDPAYTEKVAETIVRRSEEFVNDVGQQAARQQLTYVQSEVEVASKRMRTASDALIKLQRENKIFSPEAESETSSRIVAELQAELAREKTEMKALQAYLNPGASELVTVKKRIEAVEEQLALERKRQVGGSVSGVNDLMLLYQSAQLEVQLASDLYQAALKALEIARLDASRKAKYIVRVAPPSMPDQAELPRTWRNLAAFFIFLNLGYFILTLIVATIKDHRD